MTKFTQNFYRYGRTIFFNFEKFRNFKFIVLKTLKKNIIQQKLCSYFVVNSMYNKKIAMSATSFMEILNELNSGEKMMQCTRSSHSEKSPLLNLDELPPEDVVNVSKSLCDYLEYFHRHNVLQDDKIEIIITKILDTSPVIGNVHFFSLSENIIKIMYFHYR